MIFKFKNRPLKWILWHPHQKLWNWTLVRIINEIILYKPLANYIIRFIIITDTFLLKIKLKLNNKNINRRGYSPHKQINYFDLGTHKFAKEVLWVAENIFPELPNPKNIFAFEANPESYEIAQSKLKSIKNLKLFNFALVKDVPASGHIRLYKEGNGLGDSIYRIQSKSFIDVPAKQLSRVIKEENIRLSEGINIIRMNIEGSEFEVIEDLKKNNLLEFIDGFYGMWDDLSKINYEQDKRFRKLLKLMKVSPFPFNGRDLRFSYRKNLIKKSILYSILGKNRLNAN